MSVFNIPKRFDDLNKLLSNKEIEISSEFHSVSEWFREGNSLRNKGNYEAAKKAYQNALKIDPNFPAVWYNLGCTFADIGNNIEAVKSYREAVKRHPDYLEAWHNLGFALSELGRHEDAKQAYRMEYEIWKKHAQKEGRL